MGKSRKRIRKEKSHSSMLKHKKRMMENREVLNSIKDNEARRKSV
jgi:hypothetical protein